MRKVFALFTISLMLVGCAQIPKSGSVGIGPEINAGDDSSYIYYSPSLPSNGDTPGQIVSGFLSAGNGPQNDYSTARAYLTTETQATWKPSQEALIETAAPSITDMGNGKFSVLVSVQGDIDGRGVYTPQPKGTTRQLDFTLVQQKGQWRISSAPNITVLAQPNFQVLFRAYSVYFFDKNHDYLVPDVRWFPSRSATATHLAAAVLAGPQDWLAPGIAADAYGAFGLNTDAVTITDGVASVDLDSRAMKVSKRELQYVKAEVRSTLLQLPLVTSVSISISKNIQNVADIQTRYEPSGTNSLIALGTQGLKILYSNQLLYSTGELESLVSGPLEDFAIDAGGSLALVTLHGCYRASPAAIGSTPKLIDARPNLLSPEFDNRGYLWTTQSISGSSWLVSDVSGRITGVKVPARVAGASVTSFAISPDGSRVVLATSGKNSGVLVLPIVRNESGTPVALANGTNLVVSGKVATSVTWSDSTHVALVLSSSPSGFQPILKMVGGQTQSYSKVENASTVSASQGSYFILLKDGSILQLKNSLWNQVDSGAKALHYNF